MSFVNVTLPADGRYAVVSVDAAAGPRPPDSEIVQARVVSNMAEALASRKTGARPARPLALCAKMVPLPHINSVIVGNGTMAPFMTAVAGLIGVTTELADIQRLAPRMASMLLRDVAKKFPKEEFTIALVGWSGGRAHAHAWSTGDGLQQRDLANSHLISPAIDPAQHIELARSSSLEIDAAAQARWHRQLLRAQLAEYEAGAFGSVACGGRFVVATIDAAGVRLTTEDAN